MEFQLAFHLMAARVRRQSERNCSLFERRSVAQGPVRSQGCAIGRSPEATPSGAPPPAAAFRPSLSSHGPLRKMSAMQTMSDYRHEQRQSHMFPSSRRMRTQARAVMLAVKGMAIPGL
jgi:hypothetical protein